MKKIFFNFCLVFIALVFSQNLQAQTQNCTPQQVAACKKVCKTTDIKKCTVAQKTECAKICNSTSTSTAAVTTFNALFASNGFGAKKEKTTSCQPVSKACSSVKVATTKLAKNDQLRKER